MPISIGGVNIGKGAAPKKRDTRNPSSPVCACNRFGQPVPIPGISVGFWEPARLIDVTRTPYCMVNLGGVQMGSDFKRMGDVQETSNLQGSHNSFYHLHYYVYPVIWWLELVSDFMCLERGSFDIAYMSEFDLTWNDSKMQSLLNPEALLFGNPVAQMACGLDCASATADMPIDSMFWCAGCLGNMYPFSGHNADHSGGVQTSSLLSVRILSKIHRIGLGEITSTSDSSVNGKLCRKSKSLKLKKSQYKLQMVNPKSTASEIGCFPLGLSDLLYSSFKEYPYDGQDFGYLVWRKRNCCAF